MDEHEGGGCPYDRIVPRLMEWWKKDYTGEHSEEYKEGSLAVINRLILEMETQLR